MMRSMPTSVPGDMGPRDTPQLAVAGSLSREGDIGLYAIDLVKQGC